MYQKIKEIISTIISRQHLSEERRAALNPLIQFIQNKVDRGQPVNLNFICTHNSRRSHLSQLWAQVAASFHHIPAVNCYSGGTEETALFPKIAETLVSQGFEVFKIADTDNPIYAIKYGDNDPAVIGFSKKYDSPFNPISGFAAIMTCSQADDGCPFIPGAEKRIPITFEDPKISDGTPEQTAVYTERSLEIAAEMCYVFSNIKI